MIHVAYTLKNSFLHGVGLHAAQDIPKGTLVYSASPKLDVNISIAEFEALDPKERREIQYWGFLDQQTGLWHVDFDVSRFINHAKNATLTQDPHKSETALIATRDVQSGEELTQNYLEFETEEDVKRRGISLK